MNEKDKVRVDNKDKKIPTEFELSSDTFLIYDFFGSRVELYDSPAETKQRLVWTNLSSRSIISKALLKNKKTNIKD